MVVWYKEDVNEEGEREEVMLLKIKIIKPKMGRTTGVHKGIIILLSNQRYTLKSHLEKAGIFGLQQLSDPPCDKLGNSPLSWNMLANYSREKPQPTGWGLEDVEGKNWQFGV